jgi:lipopolysaccharide transport system permease protein
MWEYRELIRNLTIAELKNRYQNTTLGFFWSILGPFLIAVITYFVFRHLFQQEENFAVNLVVGIMAWRFFSVGTSACLSSVLGKPNLVTKVYIPRQILVLSSALSMLIASFLEFIVLIPIIYVVAGHLPWTIIFYPLLHFIFFWTIYGAGLILGSLYIYFRDLSQIWDVLLTAGFFTCPIVYPLSIVPPDILSYYMLNPITHFILVYRDIMVSGTMPTISNIIMVLGCGVACFAIGSYVFNKLQRRFAEEI